jgi:uncharacterized membrane protein YdbT with pleckstrin-like domain
MPVIACPDCGRDVSTLAPACPHCGRPSPAATAPILPAGLPPEAREETVWQGSPSLKLLLGRGIALLLCAAGIPLFFLMLARAGDDDGLMTIGWIVTAVAVFIAGVAFLGGWITLKSTKYTVTTQRILIESGFFAKNVDEVDMRLVDDSQFDQSLPARILGIGDITVRSSDKDTPELVMRGIGDPRAIRELIRTHSYAASQRQVFTRQT